jgi:peptidase M23-like protein
MINRYLYIENGFKQKRGVYWFTLAVIFFIGFNSCREQDVSPEVEPVAERKIRNVDVEEIPEIREALEVKLGLKSSSDAVFGVNENGLVSDFEVNWERVTEVLDTLGKTNYTFGVHDNDGSSFIFYNLVIGKTIEGKIKEPLLFKFEMSGEFIPKFIRTNSIAGFMGKITRSYLSYNGASTGNSANLKPFFGTNDSKDPCPPASANGGGDDGGNYPGDPVIFDSNDGCDWYWIDYNDSEEFTGENGEPGVTATQSVLAYLCGDDRPENTANNDDPCNNESGDVAVIPPEGPCPGNPLEHMQITGYNQGVESNVFGCVRTGKPTCKDGSHGHWGMDLVAPIGTTVYAMYGGIVSWSSFDPEGWGNYIVIEGSINGVTTYMLYGHLDSLPTISGEVAAGAPIGVSGDSETSGEPHLHIEFRQTSSGQNYTNSQKMDPIGFLGTTFDQAGNADSTNCN